MLDSALFLLGLNADGRAVNTFTPASLFPATGAWYDPSDISTLFQDSAGTTPVTTTGQPVGKMLDKSGNGNHLTQATAGLRPTYQVGGSGNAYLLFDGVDDYMAAATPTLAQPFDRISAFQQAAWTSAVWIYSDAATPTAGRLIQLGTTPQVNLTEDGGINSITLSGPAVGVNGVLTERHNGASSRAALNNAAYTTGSVGSGTPVGLKIAARGDSSAANSNIRLYGLLMRAGTLSDADIAQVRTYLGGKCGVAL